MNQELATIQKPTITSFLPDISRPLTSLLNNAQWYFKCARVRRKAAKIIHQDEKSCAQSQAELRKFIKYIADQRKCEVAELTKDINKKAGFFIKFEKELEAIAKNYPIQFAADKAARLNAIKDTLTEALLAAWDEKGVSLDYRKSVLPEPKDSMLTDKGALTLSTKRIIDQLAQNDRNWQLEIESRIKDVKLACHEADIKVPFDSETIGAELYSTDKSVFQVRLARLVELNAEQVAKLAEKVTATVTETVTKAVRAETQPTIVTHLPVAPPAKPIIPASEYGLNPEQQVVKPAVSAPVTPYPTTVAATFTGKVIFSVDFEIDLKNHPFTEEKLKAMLIDRLPDSLKDKVISTKVVSCA